VTSPQPYPLADENVSVTLDGSGNGSASWTPGQPARGGGVGVGRLSGLTVTLTGVAVSVAPVGAAPAPVNQARCSVYLSYGIQSTSPVAFQGTTVTGSTGDTDTLTGTLKPGDWVTAVWAGGDAGAVATMRILGTVNPPGT
jgi:hypothetical protein